MGSTEGHYLHYGWGNVIDQLAEMSDKSSVDLTGEEDSKPPAEIFLLAIRVAIRQRDKMKPYPQRVIATVNRGIRFEMIPGGSTEMIDIDMNGNAQRIRIYKGAIKDKKTICINGVFQ